MLELPHIQLSKESSLKILDRQLKVFGAGLCLIFLLPWAAIDDRVMFSWNFIKQTHGPASFFALLLPIVGALSLALGFISAVPRWLKAALATLLGFFPLVLLFTPAVIQIHLYFVAGDSGVAPSIWLMFSLLLLAFGASIWSANPNSTMGKTLMGIGILFCLLAFGLPIDVGHEYDEGARMPIAWLLTVLGRSPNLFSVLWILYCLLPLVLAFAGVVVYPPLPTPNRIRWANILSWASFAYLPGLFVLASFELWGDGRAVFVLFYLALAVAVFQLWLFQGGGILLGIFSSKKSLQETKTPLNEPAPPFEQTPAPLSAAQSETPLVRDTVADSIKTMVAPAPSETRKVSRPLAGDVAVASSLGDPSDLALRLRKLKQCLEENLISEAEYEEKKREILSRF